MQIHLPKIVPEFYVDPEPRVLYVVELVDGSSCNVDDAEDAVVLLDEQCLDYIRLMKRFGAGTK